jgi:hypothetical protein
MGTVFERTRTGRKRNGVGAVTVLEQKTLSTLEFYEFETLKTLYLHIL